MIREIDDMDDLPLSEDEREQLEKMEEERRVRLQALAGSLAKKRDDAVRFRKNSGIEEEWDECDDAYEGIDNANRGESKFVKARTTTGGAYRPVDPKKTTRSTVFLNITRPYVDAASARTADMILPTDDRNWGMSHTPIPELEAMLKSNAVMQTPSGEIPAKDIAQQTLDQAKEKAEKAQTRIDDWLVECQYHAEVRKVFESAARLGTGILKGPVPTKRKYSKVNTNGGAISLMMAEKIAPGSKYVDIRNFFPDASCGENIHNGSGVWERDYWSAKQLRDCLTMPEHLGYLPEEIEACLEEGPGKRNLEASTRKEVQEDERFEVWYFTGDITKEDLESTNCQCSERNTETIPSIITMVNERIIKAAISHLDSGEFTYDVMPWQRRQGHWAGIGVAKQMNVAQRMLNGAVRNMMDNAGTSAGPQIVIDKEAVRPADGTYNLYGGKMWEKMPEATMDDVRKAFMAVTIDTRQEQLMNIINFALKMAEDMTGLPLLMQGQAQSTTPDTVGGMILLNNNAHSVLRRIARTFDDCVTEPHIRRYYEYLMNDPDVPDDEKGDYCIDARGSTALVERAIHDQTVLQMGAFVKDPAFELDPALWAEEALKAQRFDPKRIKLSEEKKAALQQVQAPADPRIEAANIRAQTDIQKATLNQQSDMEELRFKADEAERQRQHEREMKDAEIQIEMMRLSTARNMTFDQIRADMAQTGLKLRTQKELAIASGKGPQVATPPTEPPQRAPAGEAYQQ